MEEVLLKGMLTNEDIEQLMQIFVPKNSSYKFKGVYRVNDLPINLFKEDKWFVIFNLDREGSGSHWTSMIKDGKYFLYFDSFGFRPPDDLRNMIKLNSKRGIVYSSNYQQQPLESDMCGWFCLNWLSKMLKSKRKKLSDKYIQEDMKLILSRKSPEVIEKEMTNKILKMI